MKDHARPRPARLHLVAIGLLCCQAAPRASMLVSRRGALGASALAMFQLLGCVQGDFGDREGLSVGIRDHVGSGASIETEASGRNSNAAAAAAEPGAFRFPSGAAFAPDGQHIAVADRLEHRIRLLSASTGAVTDLAGLPGVAGYADGSKGSATFNAPYVSSLRRTALCSVCGVVFAHSPRPPAPPARYGVSYSPDGLHLAVADYQNHRVRSIAVPAGDVTTLAGSGATAFADGVGREASFHFPHRSVQSPWRSSEWVWYGRQGSPAGGMILLPTVCHSCADIEHATCHMPHHAHAGTLVRTPRTRALLACWCSVCFAPDGRHIAVADQFNHRIRLVDAATGRVSTLAGSGAAGFADGSGADAAFNYPTGAAWSWAPGGSARDTAGASNGGGVGSAGSSITPASAGGAGAGAAAVVIAVADQVRIGWVTSPVTFTPAPPTPRTPPYRSPLVPSFFAVRSCPASEHSSTTVCAWWWRPVRRRRRPAPRR
jgi:hypothetical protein